MVIVRGLTNLPESLRGAVVTIGNFDGVHRGHQSLFERLQQLAQPLNAPTMAITFEPHPRRLLHPERPTPRITGVRGKARWMERAGLDGMFILHFTHQLQGLSAEGFVQQILVDGLQVQQILIGRNFRFGARGQGDFSTLEQMGQQHGFAVEASDLLQQDGGAISSTRVREAVSQCDFVKAKWLLGRHFEVEMRVSSGQKRGRGMGFPTANLPLRDRLHPPRGVYIVEGRVEGQWVPAVANIGINPTFGDEGLHMEVHMLSDCPDLYHRHLRVRFHAFVREEQKFASQEALIAQIGKDVAKAKQFFNLS
uniref:Riboflavin biosynthesis protein n=1 Tax=Magnetococcus massalia (strain MO-1) TaxID=451514 RepID=A0A1S7LDE4_MAGMO|nr:Riboflavin biosynthesis protein ribF [Includes: Riboflavin kinase; FMN adenylyltransferase] [Candidatus Magnetococcus massalia]